MQYKHVNDHSYVLAFLKGEEVLTEMISFCAREGIVNATFTGIGAVRGLSCGYYALEEKAYHFTQYDEPVEVVSLTGNIMQKEGAPALHAHGVFTDHENRAFGGHIESMVVDVTLEVVLTVLPSEIERVLDEDIGLFLLDCEG